MWASIPYDTILAGYCLFEILIDRSSGGTFVGCQNIFDQLFKAIKISNKFTLNRLPYVIEKCPNPKRKASFISTLKKLFQVSSFCNITTKDMNQLRREESSKVKNAIISNSEKMPKWAERLFNMRTVRNRCTKKNLVGEYTVNATTAELMYAQRTTVENELNNYPTSPESASVINNIFTSSMNDEEQQVMINIDTGEVILFI